MAHSIASILLGLEFSPTPHLLLEQEKIIAATASCSALFGEDFQSQLVDTELRQWILDDGCSFSNGAAVKIRARAGDFFQAFAVSKRLNLGDREITIISIAPLPSEASCFSCGESPSQRTAKHLNLISHIMAKPVAELQNKVSCLEKVEEATKAELVHISSSIQTGVDKYAYYRKLEDGDMPCELSLFDPLKMIKELVEAQQKECGERIEIQLELPEKIKDVFLDREKVSFIVREILSNAVAYHSMGKIRVCVSSLSELGPSHWSFKVKNHCAGFSPALLDEMRRKMQSSVISRSDSGGVGLPICLALMKRLHGRISIIKYEDIGVIVQADLPFELRRRSCSSAEKDQAIGPVQDVFLIRRTVSDSEVENGSFKSPQRTGISKSQEVSKKKEGQQFNLCALVVDDNDLNRVVLVKMLSALGIKCATAVNGKEAVEKVQNEADQFDVIFMDLMMPVMNGLEATQEIRKQCQEGKGKKIAIIASTANREDRAKCLEAGMDAMLAKPLKKGDVIKILKALKDRFS